MAMSSQSREMPGADLLPEGISLEDLEPREWASLLGGGALALFGLSRRSLTGLILAGVGGTLVYRTWQSLRSMPRRNPAIGMGSIDERPGPAVEGSPVDEASWESFPASDPPSTY